MSNHTKQIAGTHRRKYRQYYSPAIVLVLPLLSLSHVNGLMRGNVPVRNNVSIVKVDALFALVKASGGLSGPAKSAIFCIVLLFSIS